MKVLVAGASGFLGRPLVEALRTAGHEVVRLVRNPPLGVDEIMWDPANRELNPALIEGVDVIINLAGENIARGRWASARRDRILLSRVEATSTLVTAVSKVSRKPRVLLNASAVGFYGSCGENELDESSSIGNGFLPSVCLAWETHAERAERLGVRTALLRFGMILAPDGGALGRILPIFRAGLGGKLGAGTQWMSWISREDAIGAVQRVMSDQGLSGAFNFSAPNPVTNSEFTRTLSGVLHRPAVLPAPAWVLRLALGRMAVETLLASTRALPKRLEAAGYEFRHPQLETALTAMLH